MITNLAELKLKSAAMFINFSEVLQKEIRDSDGNLIGNVWDISLKPGEIYPKAAELIIRKGCVKRLYASVPWSDVLDIEDDIILRLKAADVVFGPAVKEYDLLVRRDILDQQVVDTYNHKVRRVNDVHLLKVDHEYVIAHVDIGLRSLIRRIGCGRLVDFLVNIFNKNSDYIKKDELVSWKYVQPVLMNPASMTMKLSVSQKQMSSIPAADLGDIIFDLTPHQRIAIFRTLDINTKAKVFEHLNFEEQKDILKELDKKEAAQIVTHMSSDEAADLLDRLPRGTLKNILTLIESTRAKKLSTLLGYSSDSAGGLMTTEYVSMAETMTVENALTYIKNQTREIDTIPYIYVVNEKNQLKGVTTIRKLLFAEPKDTVWKTIFPKTIYVHLHDGMKEVAYVMDKYKASAVPVVDENKVLHGIITIDDVLSQVIAIAWRKRPRT